MAEQDVQTRSASKADAELAAKLDEACWIARSLFARGKTAGSTANLSFRHKGLIYISASGGCFGTLTPESFAAVNGAGEQVGGPRPSKELPLHKMLYDKSGDIGAVIHTHSPYAVLWSCVDHENEYDCVPEVTPYLKMRLGSIAYVPFEKPGSEELFRAFASRVQKGDGFLLAHHGPVVPGATLMDAFYNLEELEETCHIAWELKAKDVL